MNPLDPADDIPVPVVVPVPAEFEAMVIDTWSVTLADDTSETVIFTVTKDAVATYRI